MSSIPEQFRNDSRIISANQPSYNGLIFKLTAYPADELSSVGAGQTLFTPWPGYEI